jgi:HEXXH motif-containing protein
MTSSLKDRARSALGARAARWYDGLAADLAEWCWSDLAGIGLNPDSYGSTRVLRTDPSAPRCGCLSSNVGWGRPLLIESFDETMSSQYGPIGLRPPAAPFDMRAFEESLARAVAQLDRVASVGVTVRALVWSVVPVDVEGPEYDTSYSDPDVPLSIFIGAHAPASQVPSLRLAEGVLHEAMHLQLSLIEDVVPLIQGSSDWRHSPWQGRPRPTQGLLHGLYVFRVVQDFLCSAISSGDLEPVEVNYAEKRVRQISEECTELAAMPTSADLTPDGRRLVASLLA